LQYLVFAAFEEDMAEIRKRVESLPYSHGTPHPLGSAEGIWVVHPEGFFVQIIAAAQCSPKEKLPPQLISKAPVGKGNAPTRSSIHQVKPRRLSHALLFSNKVPWACE